MERERELSKKEVACLKAAHEAGEAGIDPFNFASSTVSVLRKAGLLILNRTSGVNRYNLTHLVAHPLMARVLVPGRKREILP
jgi:hypothetical protein